MKFLADTSVLSQTRAGKPIPEVMRWWQQQSQSALYVSVVTIHELRFGAELAPEGTRKRSIERWIDEWVLGRFPGQILPISTEIADRSGRMVAAAKRAGHTADLADALIAATAAVHGLPVATLNRKHFEKLRVQLVKF